MVYYNENDPKLAPWLYELMAAGLIAPGYVDTRSIEDVVPDDLREFTQCHFFAGIGGWSYALRLAGWADDRPVWTGSCPCQPFSAAGKGAGFDDQRHLWPAWHWLISQCRPGVIFGEQVASKDGLAWLDLVLADLEVEGYAAGAFDLCAAGVGAPHIRQRLWIVADAGYRHEHGRRELAGTPSSACREVRDERVRVDTGDGGHVGGLAECGGEGRRQVGADDAGGGSRGRAQGLVERPVHGCARNLGDAERSRLALGVGFGRIPGGPGGTDARQAPERTGVHAGWGAVEWVACRDGKHRPTEPGIFPLAHGVPGRVGLLRGAGNAIVPQVAEQVIRAYLETNN